MAKTTMATLRGVRLVTTMVTNTTGKKTTVLKMGAWLQDCIWNFRDMDGRTAFSVYASPVAGSTFFSAMLAL